MNFGQYRKCICSLESRITVLEEGGGGGGGPGIIWRETWDDASIAYSIGDAVIWDDPDDTNGANAYYCTGDHVSDVALPPPGNTDWVLMVQGGEDGIVGTDGTDGTDGLAGAAGPAGDPNLHSFMEGPSNKTFILALYMNRAGTINSLVAKTVSGTVTANLRINGVSVTGISAVSVTSTESTTNASAANTYIIGDTIDIVLTAGASPIDLAFSVLIT